MIIILNTENKQEFLQKIEGLEQGKYIINIRPLQAKTPKEFQAQYFAQIDAVRDLTGNDRYSIHNDYKEHCGVETTKNFDTEDWIHFISDFQWYIYNNLNILI